VQLWRRCNSEWKGDAPRWRVVQGLQSMSVELGLQGDVNVHVMKIAIEGVQVSVMVVMVVKALHLFDVL
jgi:hypothetical protein